MNEEYLKETKLLNYGAEEIVRLISLKKWGELNEFKKIGAIYSFVQNEIPLGYNRVDDLRASKVLSEGIGQCNTKATLLIALLRAVGVPARLHGTMVTKEFQRSLMPKFMARLAPPLILHSWAEVFYGGSWVALEGVITDKRYFSALQRMFPDCSGKFFDYAVAVNDFPNTNIDWQGTDTFVQNGAVIEDLGIFSSPDELFSAYRQQFRGIKKFFYQNFGRKIMTKRAKIIRNG